MPPARLRHELRHGRVRDPGHERRRAAATATSGTRACPASASAASSPSGASTAGPRSSATTGATTSPPTPPTRVQARVALRRRRRQDGAEPLAAGARRTGRAGTSCSTAARRRSAPSGSPDEFNAYAQFLLGQPSYMTKTLQYELQTGREWQYADLPPRPLAGQQEPDPQPGPALGEVPAHDARGPRDRVLRRHDEQQVAPRRRRRQPRGPAGSRSSTRTSCPGSGSPTASRRDNVVRGGYGITVSPMPLLAAAARLLPAHDHQRLLRRHRLPAGRDPRQRASRSSTGPTSARASSTCPTTPACARCTPTTSTAAHPVLEPDLRAPAAVGHVGLRGLRGHQDDAPARLLDINAAGRGPGTGGAAALPAVRAHGLHRTGSTAGSAANYHSLQMALNKPFSKGFFVKAAYTFSKAMNRTDDEGWSNVDWNYPTPAVQELRPGGLRPDPHLPARASWPSCRSGRTARASATRSSRTGRSTASSAPSPGRRSPSPPPAPRSTRRGTPSTPTSSGRPTRLGGIGADNPYYDTSAWAPVTEVRPGNTGRNSVRGPGWWNIDLVALPPVPARARSSTSRPASRPST